MIEVLKQMVEALEWCYGGEPVGTAEAIKAGKQAIKELESQEPQIKTTDPFESARVGDYNRGWNDCLFASGIVKQSQRTEQEPMAWNDLTNDEIVECQQGSIYHFYRCIVSKLKEKNMRNFGSAIDLVIHLEAINERLYKDIAKLESQLKRQAIAELESQEPALYWSFRVEYALLPSEYDEEDHPTHVPLYRNPPQRKPLTDEQILNVARDHYNPHQRPEISFARAIEAAHGIKG